MNIDYKNTKIHKIYNLNRIATKELGALSAKKLKARLMDIDAAENVLELVSGRPHPLIKDRLGQYAVDLSGGARLVFAPNHDPIPMNEKKIDWSQVTNITIVFIGDYHD